MADALTEKGPEPDPEANRPVLEPKTPEAPVPTKNAPDLDSIAPAIAILKELLERAEKKRLEEAEREAQREALEHQLDSAVVEVPILDNLYVSLDGDGVGNQVARAEEANDEAILADISNKINAGQTVLIRWAEEFGGKVIESGGDEGLVRVPSTAFEKIGELRQRYFDAVGATATVGVGGTIRESTQARMLGKLRGKDRTVIFDENVPKELRLRLQMAGDPTEEKKFQEAGLGKL
jgi:hypothetical protein